MADKKLNTPDTVVTIQDVLACVTDPRDAEIARLKAELADLRRMYDASLQVVWYAKQKCVESEKRFAGLTRPCGN